MAQININVTPEFDRDLRAYMRKTGLTQKSQAIRQALREVAERQQGAAEDFREWIGLGLKAPMRRKPKFASEDDLWS